MTGFPWPREGSFPALMIRVEGMEDTNNGFNPDEAQLSLIPTCGPLGQDSLCRLLSRMLVTVRR